jgi:hypothetical protein
LVLLAKSKAARQYIPINISGKNSHPTDYCCCNEVNAIIVYKFVFTTHKIKLGFSCLYVMRMSYFFSKDAFALQLSDSQSLAGGQRQDAGLRQAGDEGNFFGWFQLRKQWFFN